jgi:iron complex outermembrane receptor protein
VFPLAPPPPGTSCAAGTTPPGFPCAGGAGNPVNALLDNDRLDIIDQDTRSYALFGEATYHFTDRLSLTLGGRYTIEDKTFALDSSRGASGVPLLPLTEVEDDWTNFTAKGGIEYQWSDELLSYFSVTQDFKAGGFNARARTGTELEPFGPEEVLSYEAGFKSQWFDNRLRFNAAGFYNDYTDIQVVVAEAVPETGQIFNRVENAGDADIKGVELEFLARLGERRSHPPRRLHAPFQILQRRPEFGSNQGRRLRARECFGYIADVGCAYGTADLRHQSDG